MSFEAFPARGDADHAEVRRLWRANLSDERHRAAVDARWRWLAEQNPAGPAKTCVVVDTSTGEVVGCASAFPRVLWIDGRRVAGGVLCDFVIDPRHRTAGPAVILQRALAVACFAEGWDLLYGFPNDRAFPIFKRVGYRAVGEANMWVKPLRSASKLRELAPGYVPQPVVRTGAFLLDQVLQLNDLRLRLLAPRDHVEEVRREIGAEFDVLWNEARAAQGVAGERTTEYLSWRYGRHPVEPRQVFCLTHGDGRLRAYVVFSVADGKVNVLDLFSDARSLLPTLLLRFALCARRLGHVSIALCHVGDLGPLERLGRLGFVRSGYARKFICSVAEGRGEQLAASAFDKAKWSLFDGELDI